MDILYIYNGYKAAAEELRFSLRSIEKNGQNVGRVFLLGVKPDWINPATVKHIPYSNSQNLYKENDITNAMFHAIADPDVPNRFLVCADDYFYIRPTDFDQYPIYVKGILPESVENKENMGGWKYVRSVVNTRALLMAAGLPVINYGQHCCFYADRPLMQEFKHLFKAAMYLEFGALYDTMMANIIVDKTGAPTVNRRDNKVDAAANIDDLKSQIGDTECFSTTERAMNNGLRPILQSLFHDKSKYEL